MKKFKFILIIAVMIISANTFGQSDCYNAVEINFNNLQNYYLTDNEFWLKFTADTSNLNILLRSTNQNPATNIEYVNLYSGQCNNLVTINTINLISTDSILNQRNLNIGETYYIQIVGVGDIDGYFSLLCSKSNYKASAPSFCGPQGCNSNGIIMNSNTGFETISANLNNLLNTSNPSGALFEQPMFEDFVNIPYSYSDVCNWRAYGGSPQIKREANGNNYLYLWARKWENYPAMNEGAYNILSGNTVLGNMTLNQNELYTLSYKYCFNGASWTGASRMLFCLFNSNNPSQSQTIITLYNNNLTGWQSNQIAFTCNSNNYNSILVYPLQDYDIPFGTVKPVLVDDVVLYRSTPVILPLNYSYYKPCSNIINLSFAMPTYQGITYTWNLPNNAVIVNTNSPNSITVNWNNAGIATASFEGKNAAGCVIYQGSVMVNPNEIPCAATYTINNTNSTQIKSMFNNSSVISTSQSISIDGLITINENLEFNNCTNVKLGANAKINVMPGCTLKIINSNFTACLCAWEGIYVEHFSAKLIIENSYISGAKNAVVSSYDGKISLYYSTFANNEIGVWIRKYNPEMIPGQGGGWILPPAHNAYIGKCKFENSSLFAKGIIIDTVYNVTIGDINNAANKNEFFKLYRAIQSTASDVNIYNNNFNENYCLYYIDIPYYLNAEPTATSIFIKRPYDINPPQINNYAIKNIVNIGGTATNQPNTFNLQEIGVYGFNTQVNILNNTFTNQRFTAIHLKDLYNSNISSNSISMQTSLSATNNLYNSSILTENSIASTLVKLNINYNTFNNTRTGINTRNCNGTSINSSYCNVTLNTINFEGLGTSAIPFIGINSASCAYTNIEQNTIKYNPTTTPNYAADYDRLKGISVASDQNAKVSKNTLVRLGMGIWGADNLLGTQFFCNNLDKNYYGFYFKPLVTQINHQGTNRTANGASDNYWYDNNNFTTPELRRIGGDIINNPRNWFHRGLTYSIVNTFSPYIVSSHPLFFRIIAMENTQANPDCGQISPVTTIKGREEALVAIVKDTIVYQAYQIENEYYAKDFAYKSLNESPSLLNMGVSEDSIYQNFYTTNKNLGVGIFDDLDKKINNDEYTDAMQINSSIVPVNAIESQKKIVNNIYLQRIIKNQKICIADSITLNNIAMQSPFTGGDAVYSARVILGLDPSDLNLDYIKAPDSKNDIYTYSDKVKIYPNPATNLINMAFENELQNEAIFELYDFNGKLILSKTIQTKTAFNTINLNMVKAGIYYYKLFTTNEILAKNKLVILNK